MYYFNVGIKKVAIFSGVVRVGSESAEEDYCYIVIFECSLY